MLSYSALSLRCIHLIFSNISMVITLNFQCPIFGLGKLNT